MGCFTYVAYKLTEIYQIKHFFYVSCLMIAVYLAALYVECLVTKNNQLCITCLYCCTYHVLSIEFYARSLQHDIHMFVYNIIPFNITTYSCLVFSYTYRFNCSITVKVIIE